MCKTEFQKWCSLSDAVSCASYATVIDQGMEHLTNVDHMFDDLKFCDVSRKLLNIDSLFLAKDRNCQYCLVDTVHTQGVLIGNLKKKLRLQAQEYDSAKRGYEAKLGGIEAKLGGVEKALAEAKEKVIALDCQLDTVGKEKEQANVELLQALSLVSAKEAEVAEVRTSYNELLPVKLSCESRILELEEKLREENALCQAKVTASCKAYAIQFANENGLSPPEFEDEESDEFGMGSNSDEENSKDKDVVVGEDNDDAPNPDDGPAA